MRLLHERVNRLKKGRAASSLRVIDGRGQDELRVDACAKQVGKA